jgi:hypothetical protein
MIFVSFIKIYFFFTLLNNNNEIYMILNLLYTKVQIYKYTNNTILTLSNLLLTKKILSFL